MIKDRKEHQPMSEWLKEDAVNYDLPPEEIIQALCEEIEKLKDSLIEWHSMEEESSKNVRNIINIWDETVLIMDRVNRRWTYLPSPPKELK